MISSVIISYHSHRQLLDEGYIRFLTLIYTVGFLTCSRDDICMCKEGQANLINFMV